jgi:hypothetical protein
LCRRSDLSGPVQHRKRTGRRPFEHPLSVDPLYAASTCSSPTNGNVALINLRHTSIVIDQLRAAAEAMNRGDPEAFASLFAEDAEWRGPSRGHLWWKHTPS